MHHSPTAMPLSGTGVTTEAADSGTVSTFCAVSGLEGWRRRFSSASSMKDSWLPEHCSIRGFGSNAGSSLGVRLSSGPPRPVQVRVMHDLHPSKEALDDAFVRE